QANESRSRETVRDLVKRLSGIYRNRCPVNPKSAEISPGILSNEFTPTASFGVAVAHTGEDLAALMDRADRALYQAKSDGRDCIKQAE
ncbi:diguanylate cyclase domain-containing protein, partial [Agrobacterium sp. ST15.13.013]|uniref:diguanylate cyclase domain-containing protein n=1 Tax=Agrobacterium sp. ST15.13.013 TaxID=3020525 RepID=UPI0022FFE440